MGTQQATAVVILWVSHKTQCLLRWNIILSSQIFLDCWCPSVYLTKQNRSIRDNKKCHKISKSCFGWCQFFLLTVLSHLYCKSFLIIDKMNVSLASYHLDLMIATENKQLKIFYRYILSDYLNHRYCDSRICSKIYHVSKERIVRLKNFNDKHLSIWIKVGRG